LLDICADDEARETICLEDIDYTTVQEEADDAVAYLRDHRHEAYTPISFWDDRKVYVEVAVEKLDLRNLFEPVCEEWHIPLTSMKGWSDLNSRATIMRRFKYWEGKGKKCVLLLCTDHDPGGLLIADTMRKNLEELSRAVVDDKPMA
jgi:hypothetical protein